jgi:uncharacterized protein with HEPN domain
MFFKQITAISLARPAARIASRGRGRAAWPEGAHSGPDPGRGRRPVRDDRERLADVLAAIDRIRRYVQDDRMRFDTDELLQNAVLHWIEIIGESARGVSDKVRDAHPEVPWRVITDMRNTYESIPLGTTDASVVAIVDCSG